MTNQTDLVQTFFDDLPSGWSLATISDLVGNDGVFKDGDWVESKDQDPNGDVRLIQLADIGDGGFRDRSSRFLTYEKAIKLRCTFLNKGDVLVARMPDPLGRACIFPGDKRKAVTVVDVCVVRPEDKDISNRWLMYFINAPEFRVVVASLQSGSTRRRISRKNLARLSFPVPPPNEQNRIVAEIEKQFSRLDEAVDNLNRVKANLKRYKASVLKAAVEGKLTEEWRKADPDVEPADKLLERILAERRKKWEEAELAKMKAKGKEPKDDKWKKKYKEPAKPNFDDLPPLPDGWLWVSLEAASEALGGYAFKSNKYSESGYQIVKMANIKMNTLDLSQRPSFITDISDHIFDKYSLIDGDILITLTGTRKKRDYGYIVEIKKHKETLLLNQRIARLRPYIQDISSYVAIAIQSEGFRDRFFAHETGNVGQGNVGMRAVTTEAIALPPFEEQKVIIVELERSFSMADRICTQVDGDLKRAERLRQSILKKAFSGKLIQ